MLSANRPPHPYGAGHVGTRRAGERELTWAWARPSCGGWRGTGWSSWSTVSTTTTSSLQRCARSRPTVAWLRPSPLMSPTPPRWNRSPRGVRRLGPIDILVVNATGPQPDIPLLETGWADHLVQLDYFVRSPVLLGRRVVPGMRARGHGRIVHIDSEVADRPPPSRSAYGPPRARRSGLDAVLGTRASRRWHHGERRRSRLRARGASRRHPSRRPRRLPGHRPRRPHGHTR